MPERADWQWRRGFQLMARNMASFVQATTPGLTDFGHADGQCICQKCGLEYIEHPSAPDATYLVLLCDGRQAKL